MSERASCCVWLSWDDEGRPSCEHGPAIKQGDGKSHRCRLKHRESQVRYRATVKGKEANRRYQRSPSGKQSNALYELTRVRMYRTGY